MDFKEYIPKTFSGYDFKRIYSGIESEVYVGSNGSKKIVLKYNQTKAGGYYNIEESVYKELEKRGIKAPRFVFSNTDKNILMISFIEGKELNGNYDLFERKSIWKGVANNLSLLRNIKCSGFGKIKEVTPRGLFKGVLNNWNDFFGKTADFIFSAKNANVITSEEIKLLHNYWKENESKINLKKGFVVHGDFCMDHIWTNNKEYSGLIDFGDAFIGDSLMDLAYFRFKEINKDYGKKIFDALCVSYFDLSDDNRSGDEKKTLINLYMIYWGINRITNISNKGIKKAFGEKIKILIKELNSEK